MARSKMNLDDSDDADSGPEPEVWHPPAGGASDPTAGKEDRGLGGKAYEYSARLLRGLFYWWILANALKHPRGFLNLVWLRRNFPYGDLSANEGMILPIIVPDAVRSDGATLYLHTALAREGSDVSNANFSSMHDTFAWRALPLVMHAPEADAIKKRMDEGPTASSSKSSVCWTDSIALRVVPVVGSLRLSDWSPRPQAILQVNRLEQTYGPIVWAQGAKYGGQCSRVAPSLVRINFQIEQIPLSTCQKLLDET